MLSDIEAQKQIKWLSDLSKQAVYDVLSLLQQITQVYDRSVGS